MMDFSLLHFVFFMYTAIFYDVPSRVVKCSSAKVNLCDFRVYNEHNNEYVYFNFSGLSDPGFTVDYPLMDKHNVSTYFTFCGEREKLPCRNEDFICGKNWTSDEYFGAGSVIQSITYEEEGELKSVIINFSGGTLCKSGEKFSTSIYLHCKDFDGGPSISNINGCELTLIWSSPAACPIKTVAADVSEGCVSEFDNLRFDLQQLHHSQFYPVKTTGKVIHQINICGPIKNGSCSGTQTALCLLFENGTSIAADIKETFHFDSSNLKLTAIYEPVKGSVNIGAKIEFICDERSSFHRLEYLRHEKSIPVFEMKTPIVCIPHLNDQCSFSGKENFYDLSSLYKHNDNWEVTSPEGNKYFFNICGPLKNLALPKNFLDENVFAIMKAGKNNETISLGNNIFLPNSDTKLIYYMGGSQCTDNSSLKISKVHNLILELICSNEQGKPIFKASYNCKHFIVLNTPAACPVQVTEGSDCKVHNPYFEQVFDFSGLTSPDDYSISLPNTSERYILNVCQSIKSCGNHSNVGVCMVDKAGHFRVIGHSSSNLHFINGQIILKMTGESCRSGGPRSTVIITFLCDHDVRNNSGLQFKNKNEQTCVFNMIWRTKKACFHRTTSICSVMDRKGNTYDLSSLMKTGSNYIVRYSWQNYHGEFILNICHSVVNEEGVICRPNDGICLHNQTAVDPGKKFISLGIIKETEGPYFDQDVLKLSYKDGSVCQNNDSIIEGRVSVIEFQCSDYDFGPQLVYLSNCHYKFSWKTKAACPSYSEGRRSTYLNNEFQSTQKTKKKSSQELFQSIHSTHDIITTTFSPFPTPSLFPPSKYFFENDDTTLINVKHPNYPDDCSVVSPSNYRFNLTPLANEDWTVQNNDGKHIIVSVCRPLKFSRSLGCTENGENCGDANNKLLYHPDYLLLSYTTNNFCDGISSIAPISKRNTKRKVTFLHFKCRDTNNGPFLVDHFDKCVKNITWETPYACEMKNNCIRVLNNDKRLSYFISMIDSNYRILNGSDEFILNCNEVILKKKLNCLERSTECSRRGYENLNLGFINLPTENLSSEEILLNYMGGSTCPHNSSLKLSSQIHLTCDQSMRKGKIILANYSEHLCQYNFIMRTNSICLKKMEQFPAHDCIIVEYSDNHYVNLSNIIQQHIKTDLIKNSTVDLSDIICQSNGQFWLLLNKLNEIKLNLTSSNVIIQYDQTKDCVTSDVYRSVMDKGYCGSVPAVDSYEGGTIKGRQCPILLKGFNLKNCFELKKEETFADEENVGLSEMALWPVLLLGVTLFFTILLLLRCRKIRQCLLPTKYLRNSRDGSRVIYRRKRTNSEALNLLYEGLNSDYNTVSELNFSLSAKDL